MKKNLLICQFFLLLGTLFAAELTGKLTVEDPPFSKTATRKVRSSGLTKWKSANRYHGASIILYCYKQGTPQLSLRKLNQYLGGVVFRLNGKQLTGPAVLDGKTSVYKFANAGTLKVALENDGKLIFDLDLPVKGKKVLSIPLLGKLLGNTNVRIDDKLIHIPAYGEKPKFNFAKLYEGKLSKVTFFSGMQENEFAFEFPGVYKARFLHYIKQKHLDLALDLGSEPLKLRFMLDPGSKEISSKPVPKNRISKVANCDLWALDRYVLPDFAGKNYLQNSSFEQGMRYLIFRDRGKINTPADQITVTSKEALFGKKSLQFVSDRGYRQPISMQTVLLPPGKYMLSFYAKTTAPGKQKLSARMVDPVFVWNPYKAPGMTVTLTGQWKRYSQKLELKQATTIPVLFCANSNVPATCYVDGVMLERGTKVTAYQPPVAEGYLSTSVKDNFLEYGKKINGAWNIIASPGAKGSVRIRIRDFFDRQLVNKTASFTIDKNGSAVVKLPELEKFPRGIFIVEADHNINGKKRYEIQRFSIMSFLNNTHKHKNLFVDTYVDPYCPGQNFTDILDRYRKLGYGARGGFANNDEALAKEHLKHNIDNIFCRIGVALKQPGKNQRTVRIFTNMEHYLYPGMSKNALLVDKLERPGPHSKAFLDKVEAAAAAVAAKSPSIRAWSFLAEAEGVLPDWANPFYATKERFRDFMDLEAAVGRGIRKGNPNALYFSGPPANISREDRMLFLNRMFEEAKKRNLRYDGIGVHCYRGAPEYPKSMEQDFERVFAIMKKHGMEDLAIYSPEGMHWLPIRCRTCAFVSDYPIAAAKLHAAVPYTYDLSFAEKIGTAYRARVFLMGLKHQDKIKMLNASNYQTFAMDALLTPYAFQKVPNTLGRLLGNARFVEEHKLHPETRCYLFEDEKKRPVVAVWACSEAVDQGESSAPELYFSNPQQVEIIDLMEAPRTPEITVKKQLRVPLSPYPVFLRGKPGTLKTMSRMLKNGICKATEPVAPEVLMKVVSKEKISLDIRNREDVPASFRMNYRGNVQKINLVPNGKKKLLLDLPGVLTTGTQSYNELVITMQDQKNNKFIMDRSFTGLVVRKATAPVVIDGDPSEWKNVPAIPVTKLFRSKKMERLGKYPDKKDFSAEYKVLWDEKGIYLAVFVKDSNYQVQKHSRINQGWKDDSLQVFFDCFADSRNNDRNRKPNADDWSYGIFPVKGTNKFNVWRFHCPDGQLTVGVDAPKPQSLANDVHTGFRRTKDGYFYEIHFTRPSIMPFALAAGNVVGMGLLVNDCDDAVIPQQTWMLTNASGGHFPNNRPDSWTLLYLAK